MSDDSNDETGEATGALRDRGRGVPTALIILAAVLTVVSAVTTWVRVQALDTDTWTTASAELLNEPEIRTALATYLVDELYTGLDVAGQLESALPDTISGLAGPLAGAIRGPVIDGVERILARPRLQTAWVEANRRAHAALVAIVRNETRENVSTTDGTIVLDLGGAVRTIGADLGFPAAALDRIPEGVGQLTVIESQVLADVQGAVRVLDFLSWFVLLVVIALFAAAVHLARGRRRETVRSIGLALVSTGVVVLAARSIAVRVATDRIVESPAGRPIAAVVGEIYTSFLTTLAATGILLGLLIVAYAAALGPHDWAVAARRRLGSMSNPRLGIALGGTALVIALAWWSPGLVFERWITAIALLASVVVAGIALDVAVRADAASNDARE